MSQTIIGESFHDTKLDDIRQMVSTKNDNTPFLMLPVRVEARYMTVDRPVSLNLDGFYHILPKFVELDYYYRELSPIDKISYSRMQKLYTRAKNDALAVIDGIQEINILPNPECSWFREHFDSMSESLTKFNKAFNNLVFSNRAQVKKYNELKKFVNETFNEITAKVSTIKRSRDDEYKEASNLISNMNKMLKSVEDIDFKVVDNQNKTKREYYSYVESRLSNIEEQKTILENAFNKNIVTHTNQLKQIKELSTLFKTQSKVVPSKLNEIQSDYKRNEFITRFNEFINPGFNSISTDIINTLIPKMEYLNELKTIEARELCYETLCVLYELRSINNRRISNYNTVKSTRIHIYKLLHNLRERGHDIIVGEQNEVNQLREAWTEVDNELEIYISHIEKVRGSNRYEKAGLTRTASHINENYREDLKGLRNDVPITEPYIKNQDFTESANSYNQAYQQLSIISKALIKLIKEDTISDDQIEVLSEQLKIFDNNFKVLSRKTTVIPEEYYKQLHTLFNNVKSDWLTIKKVYLHSARRIPNARQTKVLLIDEDLNSITKSFDNLESDITDEDDPFYDLFRKKFIFSIKTETVHELWVRIYPDDAAVTTHETELAEEEIDGGKIFWIEVWNAGGDKDLELGAWKVLCAKYGPPRAAYIRRVLDPNKVQQSSPKPVSKIVNISIEFKELASMIVDVIDRSELNTEVNHEVNDIKNRIHAVIPDLENTDQTDVLRYNKLVESFQVLYQRIVDLRNRLEAIPDHEKDYYSESFQSLTFILADINCIQNALKQIKALPHDSEAFQNSVPNFTSNIQIRDGLWTKAPRSDVMPDKFVVVGKNNGLYTHVASGNQIPNPLIVGINPANFDNNNFEYDDLGNLMVDEDIRWMTDFDTAVQNGMGIIIPLTKNEMETGFDKLFVLGVRDTTALGSKQLLENLLESHYFSPDSLSILPIGTPTNNTDDNKSDYSSELDEKVFYNLETQGNNLMSVANEEEKSDGQRLADALNVPLSLFNTIDKAVNKSISNALTMNRALWPATFGYFMEEIMDTVFTIDNIRRTHDFFVDYVSGRGYLPSIRIATQPYGIIPTTAFSKFKVKLDETLPYLSKGNLYNPNSYSVQNKLQQRFDIRLKNFLYLLNQSFQRIVQNEHLSIDNYNPQDSTPQEHFMNLLGLQPTSVENFYRYSVNCAQRRNLSPAIGSSVNFEEDVEYGFHYLFNQFGKFLDEGNFIDDTYYESEELVRLRKARIFRLRNFDKCGQLAGWKIEKHIKSTEQLKKFDDKTFIDKLITSHPYSFWDENNFENYSQNSLFFIILRHALSLEYRDVALKLLREEGIMNENTRRRAGTPETYIIMAPEQKDMVFTKWSYLFHYWDTIKEVNDVNDFASFPIAHDADINNNAFINSLIGPSRQTLAHYIFNKTKDDPNPVFHPSHTPHLQSLNDLKESFRKLTDISIQELNRMFSEHLDLCSYRLDAWQLGIANKRLHKQRTNYAQKAVYLGAYGWLENLRMGEPREEVKDIPDTLYNKGDGSVYTDEDNEGFIHTPSLNHAITAAILRSGYISNKEAGDQSNQMAVNLSSQRVRLGLKLLEGVRNGQEVGALLGYQFERALHEGYTNQDLELDSYIYILRKKFPLTAEVGEIANPIPDEDKIPNQVINGTNLLETAKSALTEQELTSDQTLYELLLAKKNLVRTKIDLPNTITDTHLLPILLEIDKIANSFDALGDLILSESVYQVAQGNYVRSSAMFTAIAEGRVPPEVQITSTPRTGHVLTQKAIIHLDPVSGNDISRYSGMDENMLDNNIYNVKPQYWKNVKYTIKAFAEPTLNKWLGEIIGDPEKIRCTISYNVDENTLNDRVKLSDLNLQPIDIINILNENAEYEGNELNSRVAYFIRNKHSLAKDIELTLNFTERTNELVSGDEVLTPEIKTFYEILPLINNLSKLIGKCRCTAADDYVIPGEDIIDEYDLQQLDVAELQLRYDDLKKCFEDLIQKIKDIYTNKGLDYLNTIELKEASYTENNIADLKNWLAKASECGLPNVLPEGAIETDNDTGIALAIKAVGILIILEKRLLEASNIANFSDDTAKVLKVEKLTEAMKKILSKSFTVVCQFKFRNLPKMAEVLTLAPEDSIMRNTGEFALDQWQNTIAKVRENMGVLDSVSLLTQNFDIEFPEAKPIQLPYETITNDDDEKIKDYWLGAEFPENYEPESDKLSLIIYNTDILSKGNASSNRVGLLIDEWIEIIPNKEETSGITFNYDQPDAEPPQSLLLAVTPEVKGKWQWDNLLYTLEDTLDLSKIRVIEPEHLDDSMFSQVLPGILGEAIPPAITDDNTGMEQQILMQLSNNNENDE